MRLLRRQTGRYSAAPGRQSTRRTRSPRRLAAAADWTPGSATRDRCRAEHSRENTAPGWPPEHAECCKLSPEPHHGHQQQYGRRQPECLRAAITGRIAQPRAEAHSNDRGRDRRQSENAVGRRDAVDTEKFGNDAQFRGREQGGLRTHQGHGQKEQFDPFHSQWPTTARPTMTISAPLQTTMTRDLLNRSAR